MSLNVSHDQDVQLEENESILIFYLLLSKINELNSSTRDSFKSEYVICIFYDRYAGGFPFS